MQFFFKPTARHAHFAFSHEHVETAAVGLPVHLEACAGDMHVEVAGQDVPAAADDVARLPGHAVEHANERRRNDLRSRKRRLGRRPIVEQEEVSPLGRVELHDFNEGLYVSAAREMYLRGAWAVPTANGELFFDKPPLMYWAVPPTLTCFWPCP